MDKLLPCPFCGREMRLKPVEMADGKTIRYYPVPAGKGKAVYGPHKSGCQLEFANSAYVGNPTTKRGAMLKWNRRPSHE